MFSRLAESGPAVGIVVDGKSVSVRSGDTVAAALLAAGIGHCRTTPVTGARITARLRVVRLAFKEASAA